jgi:hypothetical protein
MSEAGQTSKEIAENVRVSQNTVLAVLKEPICTDPTIVESLIKRKAHDLEILHGLARNNLVKKVLNGKGNIIENCCVMEKAFIQGRLLGGQSTQNHAVSIIEGARKDIDDLKAEGMKLLKMMEDD